MNRSIFVFVGFTSYQNLGKFFLTKAFTRTAGETLRKNKTDHKTLNQLSVELECF